jgi:metal-responsive CopG/Arc/MetJ family transcriptional regulator
MKVQTASTVRASISFPPDIYESLEEVAKQKKVSLAWVVRDAAERYLADRTADGDSVIEKRTNKKK